MRYFHEPAHDQQQRHQGFGLYRPPLMTDRLVTAAIAMRKAENALEKSLETFRNSTKDVEDVFAAALKMSRLGEYSRRKSGSG